jgi:hypothetical protein
MRNRADNPDVFVESRTSASVAATEALRLAAGDPWAREGNKIEHHLPDYIRSVDVCLSRSEVARLVGGPGESIGNEVTRSECSQNSEGCQTYWTVERSN